MQKKMRLMLHDYNIFPVEYYSIHKNLKSDKFALRPNFKDDNSCAFLSDHACLIYEHRPMICRTHGLPLIYTNDDNEWELSNCELNFKAFNFEEFTFDNTYSKINLTAGYLF